MGSTRDSPTALACSCPSFVEAKLADLATPMAFACRAYSFVSAAMQKVTPVASAFQACSCSSEARPKVVHPVTAMSWASACRACSSAFAVAKAAAPRIVWVTKTAPAYSSPTCSSPACFPSVFGSWNSFVPMLFSCATLFCVYACRTCSFRACSYPACCPSHVSSQSACCALPFSFFVL